MRTESPKFIERLKRNKSLRILVIVAAVIVVSMLLSILLPDDPKTEEKYALGSTFVFDDLEITFCEEDNVSWTTIDANDSDVIIVPVTLKNLKDELHSLNRFDFAFYGPSESKLEPVHTSFLSDDIYYSGSIQAGESIDSLFHIPYDGDGDYSIVFENRNTTIEVSFPIVKPDKKDEETTGSDTKEIATEESSTEPPVTEPIATDPPVTDSPATEPPVTESPVTNPPATDPPETQPPQNPENQKTVYYTKSGDCYHYENPCGKGTYYSTTLGEALQKGLRPCEKCVLH